MIRSTFPWELFASVWDEVWEIISSGKENQNQFIEFFLNTVPNPEVKNHISNSKIGCDTGFFNVEKRRNWILIREFIV